jgi:hypothetical protein
VRFCHLARIIERDASDDEAARRRLRVNRRYDIAGFSSSLGREVSASNELRQKFVEHFADVFRDHMWIGRAQGTLETRRLEPGSPGPTTGSAHPWRGNGPRAASLAAVRAMCDWRPRQAIAENRAAAATKDL